MTNHSALAERIRRANPVGDPADPPTGAVGADVVLLAIERRSTTVPTTTQPKQPTRAPRKRWSGPLIAAAAFTAVVIVVGSLALFGNNEADEPVATTQAPNTTEPMPTTTQASPTTQATTTTVAAVESFPGVPELSAGRLDPGPVAARTVPIPFALSVPDASADYERPFWVVAAGMPGPGIVPGESVFDPSAPLGSIIFPMTRAQDAIDQVVTDLTNEVPVAETSEATIGGQPAIQIDVELFSGFYPLESLARKANGEPNFGIDGEFTNRFYIVDTPHGTLIIWFEIAPEQVETLLPYWEKIITTVEFGP